MGIAVHNSLLYVNVQIQPKYGNLALAPQNIANNFGQKNKKKQEQEEKGEKKPKAGGFSFNCNSIALNYLFQILLLRDQAKQKTKIDLFVLECVRFTTLDFVQ